MKIAEIIKNLEKYNSVVETLGLGEEKEAEIQLSGCGKITVKTMKELKKIMKKEFFDDYIEAILNAELIQSENYKNEFSGIAHGEKVRVGIY